jgi:ribosomal protein L3 glutamine methyltransferase
VVTRKPAAYLVKQAWIGPHRFAVDERVIVPRSFIGELLREGLADVVGIDPAAVRRILDLCTGSGCLAVLAALEFPAAAVHATDISRDALAVAAGNVKDYDLAHRLTLHACDLFPHHSPGPADGFDLIIANPPYVTDASVAAFPPEYKAEPALAHTGGADGMDLVRRILDEASRWLTADGTLVMEIGRGRPVIERDYPDLAFLWLDTRESEGEVLAVTASQLAGAGVGRKGRTRRKGKP